jgi:hypothetical protein
VVIQVHSHIFLKKEKKELKQNPKQILTKKPAWGAWQTHPHRVSLEGRQAAREQDSSQGGTNPVEYFPVNIFAC